MSNHPSHRQFLDLFNWSSPGLLITDEQGAVLAANKAAGELLGRPAVTEHPLPAALGIDDYPARFAAGEAAENLAVTFAAGEFPAGFANLGFGEVAGRRYGFWAVRPTTSAPAPAPGPADGDEPVPGSGAAWIALVGRLDPAYVPVSDDVVPLIEGLYDHCPVAIHLIEEDGTVAYANWKDIDIVGASEEPQKYVGHHIRHSYADQEVVDDFLGRWGDDAPIIDFRADFLNQGSRVPVVIFSTANVENGTLTNTRCFVFSDDDPTRRRDRVAALDLDF